MALLNYFNPHKKPNEFGAILTPNLSSMKAATTHVAIVEDGVSIAQRIERGINHAHGLNCTGVYYTGQEAIDKLNLLAPDVVIMDIGLPDMSGVTCMLKLKKQRPKLQFLIFTAFDNDEYLFDALKAGAVGYMLKEDNTEKIIQGIYDLMDGKAPINGRIARKVLMSFQPSYNLTVKEKLSPKERETLDYLAKGLLYKEIASKMNVTEGTIKQNAHRIYKKLEVNNRTEAISKYLNQ